MSWAELWWRSWRSHSRAGKHRRIDPHRHGMRAHLRAVTHYSLAASDEEHRRLIALASAEFDHVVEACRRAGVTAGATVVDLGCGPLGALSALSSVVGPSGTVVGIDASATALERARQIVPHVQIGRASWRERTGDS